MGNGTEVRQSYIHQGGAHVPWLQHPNPAVREMAGRCVDMLRHTSRTRDGAYVMRSIAEIITPVILDYLTIDDIWGQIYDYEDWTGTRPTDHAFRMPAEVIGHKHVITYQNGAVLPVTAFNQKYIGVLPEEIATPAFPYDIGELERPDAIASLQDMEEAATRMINIYKARHGYHLLADGFDDAATTVDVVTDDGSYTPNGMFLAYIPQLRDKIMEHIVEMQDAMGSKVPINMLTRQVTVDRLTQVGMFGADGTDPYTQLDRVRVMPTIKPIIMPPGTDNIDGWAIKANVSRPIFTRGDILLIGPRIGAYAQTRALDPSTLMTAHWQSQVAWRLAYAWVRWIDKGDLNRIRRVLFLRKVGVMGEARGTVVLDGVWTGGASFYSSRPIDKATVSNSTIVISASHGGSQATGTLTPVVKGDLRHFNVTFATPLTAGTLYYVTTTTGLHDLGGDQITALAEQIVPAGG